MSKTCIQYAFSRIKTLGISPFNFVLEKRTSVTQTLWMQKLKHFFPWSSLLILTALVPPAIAADKINFFYGSVGLTLQIESLAIFATEGKVNPDLRDFFNIVKPSEDQEFKAFLITEKSAAELKTTVEEKFGAY